MRNLMYLLCGFCVGVCGNVNVLLLLFSVLPFLNFFIVRFYTWQVPEEWLAFVDRARLFNYQRGKSL